MPKVAEGMRKLGQRALPLTGESQTRNPHTQEVTPQREEGSARVGTLHVATRRRPSRPSRPSSSVPGPRHWVESACEDTSSWQRGVGGWAQVSEI